MLKNAPYSFWKQTRERLQSVETKCLSILGFCQRGLNQNHTPCQLKPQKRFSCQLVRLATVTEVRKFVNPPPLDATFYFCLDLYPKCVVLNTDSTLDISDVTLAQ